MTTPNNGGAAFPALNFIVPHDLAEAGVRRLGETQGMTLRDYFAAKAMAGLIASNDEGAGDRIEDIPEYAYMIADAMLQARALSNIEGGK